MGTVARYGRTLIEDGSPHQLADRLTHVISAGLIRAKEELGRNLDIPSLPMVLSGLVAAVARGELDAVDPEDAIFKQLVADLAAHAAA